MSPSEKRRRHALRPATLTHWFEYLCIVFGAALLRCVPAPLHAAVAQAFGLLWYWLVPVRRAVALENLRQAFPDESEKWRRRTARRSVAHFVRMMGFEFLRTRNGAPARISALVDGIDGMEHYEAAGGDEAAGIFVSGHLGNWELFISFFSRVRERPSVALAKPMHNPLAEKLVARARAACGWKVVSTNENPARGVLRAVRQKKLIAFLADQDARREGVFVPFFGREASTARGPALFARRYQIPLVFGVGTRAPETGRYRLRFFPPIQPDRSLSLEEDVERITRLHAKVLEEAIREYPEQYFWFHRRWKTRPKRKHKHRKSDSTPGSEAQP